MLKTSIDNTATPSTIMIAYGGIKGYLKKPFWFLLKTLMKVPNLKKKLPKKISGDIKMQVALISAMYLILKKNIDENRALSTVQAIITPVAIAVQLGNFRYAEIEHSFENLKKNHERAISESPTRANVKEIVESSDKKFHFRVKSCIHLGLFKRLGVPELTQIMCNVDNALYNIYYPDKILFHRGGLGKTIYEGNSHCEFICEHIL